MMSITRSYKILLNCCLLSIVLSVLSLNVKAQERSAKLERQVFKLINEYRVDKGLSELEYLDDAADVAYTHTEDMAKGKMPLGHDGFEARFKMLKKPYPEIHAFAENVASGDLDAKGAVDLWLHSAGHRKNIQGNYSKTGIGVARARNGTYYFTQVFIK